MWYRNWNKPDKIIKGNFISLKVSKNMRAHNNVFMAFHIAIYHFHFQCI